MTKHITIDNFPPATAEWGKIHNVVVYDAAFDEKIPVTPEYVQAIKELNTEVRKSLGLEDGISIEQMCREVLQKAVDEGIVTFNRENFGSTESPMEMTAGDLCGVANLLSTLIK
jgi:hypothetical protein